MVSQARGLGPVYTELNPTLAPPSLIPPHRHDINDYSPPSPSLYITILTTSTPPPHQFSPQPSSTPISLLMRVDHLPIYQHRPLATTTATTMSSPQPPEKHLINLIRGWPSPSLHPTTLLSSAAQSILSNPETSVPALQYGPDSGYEPLKEALASWLTRHYHGPDSKYKPDPERICITGGASQNLANILASFTDPVVTRRIWMVAPCYHLACSIFEDAGFQGRLRAVPEDEDGIDVDILERKISALEKEEENERPDLKVYLTPYLLSPLFSSTNLIIHSPSKTLAQIENTTNTSSTSSQPVPTPPAKPSPSTAAKPSSNSPVATTPSSSATTSTTFSNGQSHPPHPLLHPSTTAFPVFQT